MDWANLLGGIGNIVGQSGTAAADIINANTFGNAVQNNPLLSQYYGAQYASQVTGTVAPNYLTGGIGGGTLIIIVIVAIFLLRKK